jgi:beta-glucosidase
MSELIAKGASSREVEEAADGLLAQLSLDEKVFMLSGHGFLAQMKEDGGRYGARLYHVAAGNERLGIPPLLFNDGPRGVNMGHSTAFPVPMARGASFDVGLERRIGDAIGRELRAHGGNLFGGVCINLLRHPAWGRAQETYGEDPFLLGAMGVALAGGVQHHNVVATAKHFAANSMENARFEVDVAVAERPLREVYLRHFERCVAAGVGAVMSAYNRLNGAYCGHNEELLTRILKGEWGFDGFVYSDFILGCRGWEAFPAGLDVEAPDTIRFGGHLRDAIQRGEVTPERVDDGVRRVLRTLLRTLSRPDPEGYGPEVIACSAHVALAREAAQKSIVLLHNEGVLPLDSTAPSRLLVLGRLADVPNLGDHGSSDVFPPEVVTPLAGLRAAATGCEIVHDAGDDLARVRELATEADAVLVVAGYDYEDEGEYIPGGHPGEAEGRDLGGDRLELGLGAEQEALILAAADANPRTIVAVMAGSAVLMEPWRERVAAILMLWYPGMAGGHALAAVLFGHVDASGRLPFSVVKQARDLPFFDPDARAITYDLWHGYTRLEREGVAAVFPFGFGLSYTRFAFANPAVAVDEAGEALKVAVDVANRGDRAGETVVQVYAGFTKADPEHPRKRLCGFARVALAAGESRRVTLDVTLRDLAWFDRDAWRLGETEWTVHIGASSADRDLQACEIRLSERSWPVHHR